MKKLLLFFASISLMVIAFTVVTFAQDRGKTDPKMIKVLVDTTLIRAVEVTLAPGEKSNEHTHPAHFFYMLTDGKLKVHFTDGETEEFVLKAGESGFFDPEDPHVTENAGDKTLKFLLVELKEHPYKASD